VEHIFSQSELEAIAAALADTSEGLTGSEIGHILATLQMADPTPTMTKWKRLHNAFVERQNHSNNRRAILQFIREAMRPARYAKQLDRFEPLDYLRIQRASDHLGDACHRDLGTVNTRCGTFSSFHCEEANSFAVERQGNCRCWTTQMRKQD